jgi:putative tryptophan/tyrosine transport system substrate-binding protein
MKRRDFIAGLGSAVAWSVVARAQQGERVRRIGVLMSVPPEDQNGRDRVAVFRQALQAHGWMEGLNVRIGTRATGERKVLDHYAAELVALAPDVILAGSGLATEVLQQATHTVPIVFASTNNPVGFGYVKSLCRPGGNMTGFSNIEFDFSKKYLELLKDISPVTTRAAVLRPPGFPSQLAAITAAALSLHVQASPVEMRGVAQIQRAIAEFAAEPNSGLIVTASSLATIHSKLIIDLAARHRLPAVYPNRLHVVAGGLASYGPAFLDQFRGAADYVDRILRGEKPADLPVQLPTKFEMVVNLKTAKALGLTIPETVLATADEVIQ